MKRILVGAHAGARCHAPENTVAAIEKAVQLGSHRVEFDVRRSLDGELVLMHDETVDRMTDGTGRVADLTISELHRLKVGGTETVPTLREILELTRNRCRLLVELKDAETADQAVGLIQAAGRQQDCTISSFEEQNLVRVGELDPAIATAYFLIHPKPFEAANVIQRLGVRMLIVWPRAAGAMEVRDAKSHGLHVRCGLPDDLTYKDTWELFQRVAGWGVDEIASGRPDWLVTMCEKLAEQAAGHTGD